MQLIPLGTNGFFASFNRETACFAMCYERKLILLDAGSGLFRLAQPEGQKLLSEADEIHLFLSHYHLDHAFGFYGAFHLLRGKKVTVFAPTGKHVFSDIGKEYFPVEYEKLHQNFSWKILRERENTIDNYTVKVRKQDHRGEGSFAFVFSFGVAYVTDSEYTSSGVDFVRGVKLLLHEHYRPGSLEEYFDGEHVTTFGAATIAKEAGIGKLTLIHHYPFADEVQLQSQLRRAQSIFPQTVLAKDLEVIEF